MFDVPRIPIQGVRRDSRNPRMRFILRNRYTGIDYNPGGMSGRILNVTHCLAWGLSNRDISQRLGINLNFVGQYNSKVYEELDLTGDTHCSARVIVSMLYHQSTIIPIRKEHKAWIDGWTELTEISIRSIDES